jgi:polyphosphate kinase
MDRNFFSRVEIMFPILNDDVKLRIINNLDTYLADNTHAWELLSDGSYRLFSPKVGEARRSSQRSLLLEYADVS